MPNHKSAKKRVRQNKKRNLRNRTLNSTFKTTLKSFATSIEEVKKEEVQKLLSTIHKTIDKAQTKNIITKNKASRMKSRYSLILIKPDAVAAS